jgi:hypothetical protein
LDDVPARAHGAEAGEEDWIRDRCEGDADRALRPPNRIGGERWRQRRRRRALARRLLGVDADVALVIASGIGALIGAVVAPPGNVVTERKPRVAREGGYSAVEVLLVVFLALCCLIVLAWLL